MRLGRFHVSRFILSMLAVFVFSLAVIGYGRLASAGPAGGETLQRYAAVDSSGVVLRSVLVATGAKTMANVTPINSAKHCVGDAAHYTAQVNLNSALTGTNPTLAIELQNSIDNGATWTTVHTFTQINATVTPAQQTVDLADVAASTAIVFGDCFRMRYTWGGTGTVTANWSGAGLGK